jgi:hypothetical protein
MGEKSAYRILVGKPGRKRPLGRTGRRMYNIKMDFRQIGWEVCTSFFWLRIGTSGEFL